MTSQPGIISDFIDAAADRVARLIAETQREAKRESELREAQFVAKMAELESRIASVAEIERRMGERLASVKDGDPGTSVTIDDVLPALTEAAERAATEKAESILATWERPQNGASVTVDDVKPMLRDLVTENVNDAVAGLPVPKDGEPGKDGKLPIVKAWEDRVHYEGEVVTFDGSAFQAVRDTGKAPGHEDWNCIVRAGRNGEDGKSLAIRGTWDEAADYDALDIVTLNGAAFGAKHDNPGPCPGEGWQLLAAQGKRGKPGEKGPTGVGLRGLPGAPVKRAEVSPDGLLRLHNGDGSTVECDLYPLLAKIGG